MLQGKKKIGGESTEADKQEKRRRKKKGAKNKGRRPYFHVDYLIPGRSSIPPENLMFLVEKLPISSRLNVEYFLSLSLSVFNPPLEILPLKACLSQKIINPVESRSCENSNKNGVVPSIKSVLIRISHLILVPSILWLFEC